MGQHYSHIDFGERRQIQDMVAAGVPVTAIARHSGRHRSTIHREIARNFYHTSFRDRWGREAGFKRHMRPSVDSEGTFR